MKRPFVALAAAFFCSSPFLHAYPGPIDTWHWNYFEDGYFQPRQISAATDPDGRLHTLFLDETLSNYGDANGSHRVCPPIMQSFRVFPDGTLINEYRGMTVDNYTLSSKKAPFASYNSALEPRRTSTYSVAGSESVFAIGGAYRRLLPSETFGSGRSISHSNHYIPMAFRPVVDNAAYEETDSDTLAIASTPTKQNLDMVLNEARLEVQSVTSASPVLILRYSQTTSAGFNSVFLRSLADGTPAGWADNRVFTGGSLAMTSDRRDFFAFVTSYKVLSPGGQLTTEARVFRLRTAGNTTDPIIGIEAITNAVVAESTLAAGTPVSSAMIYPQIAVLTTDEPKWVAWENPATGKVHVMKRVPGTSGTAEEKARTITNGYVSGFGGVLGELDTGSGPSIALDRLSLLHFVFKSSTHAVYGRENGGGGFTSWVLLGTCAAAPAVAVGPGQYPYVIYLGTKPGSPNSFNKLVVAYPSELEAAYGGDFEDRDHDGRLALMELAQGSSDTVIESGATLKSLGVTTTLTEVTPGDRRVELGIRLNYNAARQGSTTTWNLADGGDTVEIKPTTASNPAGTYFTSGLTVTDEFAVGAARYVTIRTTTPIGSPYTSQFFRFQVRRILGPP